VITGYRLTPADQVDFGCATRVGLERECKSSWWRRSCARAAPGRCECRSRLPADALRRSAGKIIVEGW